MRNLPHASFRVTTLLGIAGERGTSRAIINNMTDDQSRPVATTPDRSPGLQPGKLYPNTTEAGFMKVNDNAGSQRVAK
jgi:hypothetical protein